MLVSPDLSRTPLECNTPQAKEMISVSRVGAKTKVRVNSSSISVILTCMRKAEYSLVRKLKPKVESAALTFGTAVHKALEVFYSEPRQNRNIPKDFRKRSELIPFGTYPSEDHFLYRAVRAFVEKAETLRALPDSDRQSLTSGVWLLQNYFEIYITDPFVVMHDKDGPITERTCEVTLYEDESLIIELFGTIDVVLQNEQTGVILPADHKTSSMVGPDFYSRLRPNHQYTGYVYLAQKVLGLKTDSFLVNCLQKKSKPLTPRGGPPQFPRQVTRRSDEDIQEYIEVMKYCVHRYLEALESGNWILGDVNACAMYQGCTYLDVCSAPKSLRENIIESKFFEEK